MEEICEACDCDFLALMRTKRYQKLLHLLKPPKGEAIIWMRLVKLVDFAGLIHRLLEDPHVTLIIHPHHPHPVLSTSEPSLPIRSGCRRCHQRSVVPGKSPDEKIGAWDIKNSDIGHTVTYACRVVFVWKIWKWNKRNTIVCDFW